MCDLTCVYSYFIARKVGGSAVGMCGTFNPAWKNKKRRPGNCENPSRECEEYNRGNLLRQDHGIDDVNYAVGASNVSLHHVGVIDHHLAALGHDLHILAIDGFSLMQFHNVLGHDFAWDNVIREDRNQLVVILRLEKFVQSSSRQLRESFVRWGENGKRPRTFQRIDQSGSLKSGGQRFEVPRGHSSVNDVFLSYASGRC